MKKNDKKFLAFSLISLAVVVVFLVAVNYSTITGRVTYAKPEIRADRAARLADLPEMTYKFQVESDCCESHEFPGCDDYECEEIICDYLDDEYCCEIEWDGECVWEAFEYCGGLCTSGQCTGDFYPPEACDYYDENQCLNIENYFGEDSPCYWEGDCYTSEQPFDTCSEWYENILLPVFSPYEAIQKCAETPECYWETEAEGFCAGEPHENAGVVYDMEQCASIEGCEWRTGSCNGTPMWGGNCDVFVVQLPPGMGELKCNETPFCYWEDDYCYGTIMPGSCHAYNPDQCSDMSDYGCTWIDSFYCHQGALDECADLNILGEILPPEEFIYKCNETPSCHFDYEEGCIGDLEPNVCNVYNWQQCNLLSNYGLCVWNDGPGYCYGAPTSCNILTEWGQEKCLETDGCEWVIGEDLDDDGITDNEDNCPPAGACPQRQLYSWCEWLTQSECESGLYYQSSNQLGAASCYWGTGWNQGNPREGCWACGPSNQDHEYCENECTPTCSSPNQLVGNCRWDTEGEEDCENSFHINNNGEVKSCYWGYSHYGEGPDCFGCGPENEQEGLCSNECLDYYSYNPDQTDTDDDEYGDACDTCPELQNNQYEDWDYDRIGDACDTCPEEYNTENDPGECRYARLLWTYTTESGRDITDMAVSDSFISVIEEAFFTFYRLAKDGTMDWAKDYIYGERIDVGDINDDGKPEIVAAYEQSFHAGYVDCYDFCNSDEQCCMQLSAYCAWNGGTCSGTIDCENYESNAMIAGPCPSIYAPGVAAFDEDGNYLWHYTTDCDVTDIEIADVDDDGVDDVLVSDHCEGDGPSTYAINGSGNEIWANHDYFASALAYGDLNNDGVNDVAIISEEEYYSVHALDGLTGNELWSSPFEGVAIEIGDIDGDELNEVVAGGSFGECVDNHPCNGLTEQDCTIKSDACEWTPSAEPYCTGTPELCVNYNETQCSDFNCSWAAYEEQCLGYPIYASCRMYNDSQCINFEDNGCSYFEYGGWWNYLCEGTPLIDCYTIAEDYHGYYSKEYACSFVPGCSWDSSNQLCYGNPIETSCRGIIDMQVCSNVPGCDWDYYNTPCDGTVNITCSQIYAWYGAEKCEETPGCYLDKSRCSGGLSNYTCEDVFEYGGIEKCMETPGCTWYTGDCINNCSKYDDANSCWMGGEGYYSYCEWERHPAIAAYEHDGAIKWNYSIGVWDYVADIEIGDIDNDRIDEVAAISELDSLYMLEGDGSLMWSKEIDGQERNREMDILAIADVNKDEGNELVAGTYSGRVYVYDKDGNIMWNYKIEEEDFEPPEMSAEENYSSKNGMSYNPIEDIEVLDVNEDGILDILAANQDTVYAFAYPYKFVINVPEGYDIEEEEQEDESGDVTLLKDGKCIFMANVPANTTLDLNGTSYTISWGKLLEIMGVTAEKSVCFHNSPSEVCVLDSENLASLSADDTCTDAGEFKVPCPGAATDPSDATTVTCTLNGTTAMIGLLNHSGVSSVYSAAPTPAGGPSGGGGTACVPKWNCTEWSECVCEPGETAGMQTRTCTDANGCHLTYNKPAEEQSCECAVPGAVPEEEAEEALPPEILPAVKKPAALTLSQIWAFFITYIWIFALIVGIITAIATYEVYKKYYYNPRKAKRKK